MWETLILANSNRGVDKGNGKGLVITGRGGGSRIWLVAQQHWLYSWVSKWNYMVPKPRERLREKYGTKRWWLG